MKKNLTMNKEARDYYYCNIDSFEKSLESLELQVTYLPYFKLPYLDSTYHPISFDSKPSDVKLYRYYLRTVGVYADWFKRNNGHNPVTLMTTGIIEDPNFLDKLSYCIVISFS